MQDTTAVGRPPLPPEKKQNIRRVALFNKAEWDEISEYLERTGKGVNDLLREGAFKIVRARRQSKPKRDTWPGDKL